MRYDSLESVYSGFEKKIKLRLVEDLKLISKSSEPQYLFEEMAIAEEEFQNKMEKLDFFKNITTEDEKKVVSLINKIIDFENINDYIKEKTILSYIVLVNYFKKIHERSDEEIMFLSAASINLDLADYTFYIGVLSESVVSESIKDMTSNFRERVSLCYQIMEELDTFDYDYLSPDNFDELVDGALGIIEECKSVYLENEKESFKTR